MNRERKILQRILNGFIFRWVFENRNSYRKIVQEMLQGFLHRTYQQEILQKILIWVFSMGNAFKGFYEDFYIGIYLGNEPMVII